MPLLFVEWVIVVRANGEQVLSLYSYCDDDVRQPWRVDDGSVEIDESEVYRLTLRGWWATDQSGESA